MNQARQTKLMVVEMCYAPAVAITFFAAAMAFSASALANAFTTSASALAASTIAYGDGVQGDGGGAGLCACTVVYVCTKEIYMFALKSSGDRQTCENFLQ